MTVQAPFHPDTGQLRNKGPETHEPLDDIVGDEGSSRTQRWIGWVCGILTAAAVVAAWRLL